ncbi:hypothetical protein N018_24850 [Pseudomonas syringae CC1557]|uniref:YfbU family protein n=1 Tax=Pseudomonas syringae CC1557 TaxID=1357279 RepID=W0N2J1_PSESX|nr:YfbU family protein [Pseudomonas syringae]AHG43286.1 hypothetical protein N018_24850 [Pseudomonas syringae CC1557]
MKFTNPEKLIVFMLAEISEKLQIESIDSDLIKSAIVTENTWAIDWEMPGIVGGEAENLPEDVVKVVSYLEMWERLEEAFANFNDAQIATFGAHANTSIRSLKFPGFDGNNEAELLSITRMLVEQMGRFSRFLGRDLNSHFSASEHYENMYSRYSQIQERSKGFLALLSPEDVAYILRTPQE